MKLDFKAWTGAAAVLVGVGVAAGIAATSHSPATHTPSDEQKVAAVSTAAPVSSPAVSRSASTVVLKPAARPAVPVQKVAPVAVVPNDVAVPTDTAVVPAPTPEPSVIQASGAGVVGADGQLRPVAPTGPLQVTVEQKPAPNSPSPSPSVTN